MIAQGLGIAVVGLANQLLTGYNLLSTARSFGRDYGDLDFQLTAEKLCLEKWAEAWAQDHRNRSDNEQCFAIDALARISVVLAELLEYSSKYGMPDGDRSPRKRDSARALYQSISDSFGRTQKSPQLIQPQLSPDVVELLTQSHLLSLYQIRPELENEVERLRAGAESLQRALPTMKKLRWAFVDKDKFERLIGQLKGYNETLNRALLPARPSPRGLPSLLLLSCLGAYTHLKQGSNLMRLSSHYQCNFHSLATTCSVEERISTVLSTQLSKEAPHPMAKSNYRPTRLLCFMGLEEWASHPLHSNIRSDTQIHTWQYTGSMSPVRTHYLEALVQSPNILLTPMQNEGARMKILL